MARVMPNVFIVGAARAGTTSLHTYLGEHPQVFMSPVKEPHFFSRGMSGYAGNRVWWGEVVVRDWDEYGALFSRVRDEIAIGEASPTYLPDPEAAGRIRQHLPEARIIITLRDPIERAYSRFLLQRRLGLEPSSDFLEAAQRDRDGDLPHYLASGYAPKLQRYLEEFPTDQVQIHLYDELEADAASVVRSTFRFIGVDDTFEPDTRRRHNVGGEPKRPRIQALWDRLPRRAKSATDLIPERLRARAFSTVREWHMRPVPLASGVRQQLLPIVRDDTLATQDLIGRDLSAWLV